MLVPTSDKTLCYTNARISAYVDAHSKKMSRSSPAILLPSCRSPVDDYLLEAH